MTIDTNKTRREHVARRVEALRILAEKGLTRAEACAEIGVTDGRLRVYIKRFGIQFARPKRVLRTSKFQFSEKAFRDLLHYEPSTGQFTWRAFVGATAQAGWKAGSPDKHGYIMIRLGKKLYRAHRLAWLYVHGAFPTQMIDHIDGDKANNRISNLRDVGPDVNSQNTLKFRNKYGYQGVKKARSKFAAVLRVGGVAHHIGHFDTPELAHSAYVEAKRALHPGFAG